jgi:hypothetical protein
MRHPAAESDGLPRPARREVTAELSRRVLGGAVLQAMAYVAELGLDLVANFAPDEATEVGIVALITLGLIIMSYYLGRYTQWTQDANHTIGSSHGQTRIRE